MAETFNFCPNSLVPETLPPEPLKGVSMNGWAFSSRPTIPYQKRFKVTLYGLQWFTHPASGEYDLLSSPKTNARLLELFYERNGVWRPFNWFHPHLGQLSVKFESPVVVPAGLENSGGLIEKVELQLIHDNPRF